MIKAIFTALTGIDDSMESPEAQAQWERQKYLDENDLDDDSTCYQDTYNNLPDVTGEECITHEKRGFLGLW